MRKNAQRLADYDAAGIFRGVREITGRPKVTTTLAEYAHDKAGNLETVTHRSGRKVTTCFD